MAIERLVAVAPTDPGGYDAHYTSLANAIAGEAKSLVALDRVLVIECHAMTDTTPVMIAGFATDATRYVIIRAAEGASAGPIWQTDGSVYTLDIPGATALQCEARYARISGLQLRSGSSGGQSATLIIASAANITLDGLFVRNDSNVGYAAALIRPYAPNANEGIVVRNLIAWLVQGGANAIHADGNTYLDWYNCTGYAPNGTGIHTTRDGHHFSNCVAIGGTGFNAAQVRAGSHNASSDGTAPGTSALHGIANPLADPDNGDFRLVDGSPLIDAGGDLSSTGFDWDIAGTSRPQGSAWDIGAFELIATDPEPDERLGYSVTRLTIATDAGARTDRRGATTTGIALDSTAAATTERAGATETGITLTSTAAGTTERAGSTTTDLGLVPSGAGSTVRSGATTTHLDLATDAAATTERAGATTTTLGLATTGPGLAARIGATLSRLWARSTSRGSPGDVDERAGWSITRLLVASRSAGHAERRGATTTRLETRTEGAGTTERAGATTTRVGVLSTAAALATRAGRSLTRLALRSISRGMPTARPVPRAEHIVAAESIRRVASSAEVPRIARSTRIRRVA